MNRIPVCDFCGRPERGLRGQRTLEMDEDGLWVCSECRARIVSKPIGYPDDDVELEEEIQALVGKSAGAICRTLDLPYKPPYQAIIDAASKIAYDENRYMSAWLFVTQWMDGTTVWESEDRRARAKVTMDGGVEIETKE